MPYGLLKEVSCAHDKLPPPQSATAATVARLQVCRLLRVDITVTVESNGAQASRRLLLPPPPSCNVTARDFTVHRASRDLEAKAALFMSPRLLLITG